MTEHTHLSEVKITKDGEIVFNFAPQQDSPAPTIAGMAIPPHHDAGRIAQQLAALVDAGALHTNHAHAVARHDGMQHVAELYKPQPPKEPAKAAGENVGHHTANYLAAAASAQQEGPAL